MTQAKRDKWRVPSGRWLFQSREDIATVVDLGAQKIACAIVLLTAPRFGPDAGPRNIRVLGSAVVRSSGVAGGRIVNMIAAEASVRRVVAQAEAKAGVTVEDVIVTGQFQALATHVFDAVLGHGQAEFLQKEDVEAIARAAADHCASRQRKLLHVFTAAAEAADATDVIAISMPLRGARQLAACFGRSLLTAQSFVAGPLAASLSVTNALERTGGILVVDMGAQSTGFVLFSGGTPMFADIEPAAGQHITDDISRAFALKSFEAERLKIRYGSVFDGLQADVDLPANNKETREPISKLSLNHVIRLRVTAILKAVNERLKGAGYSVPQGGIVLTGGSSLLPGVRELAAQLLKCEVRVTKPMALNGLEGSNSLSALIGACLYASRHQPEEEMAYSSQLASRESSYASRIGQWLRASF